MTTAYPVLPLAAGTLARVLGNVLNFAVVSVKAATRAIRHRRDARMLAGLDSRMLADIGITRSDVNDAFAAPLWEDPTTLLSERAIERRMNRARLRTIAWDGDNKAFRRPPTNRPARQAV
ncbi:DUF1127 domain-containing protein [Undibacter mobilis]|uniref:DUF1127 domain-containing protein n=1 Tax=Undibacter mobilis TaxID=2292256 RepID=A0A371BDR9_9BRAD|nr:DUF1127 domain-containing protein [Undibacter mobilis]RDV05667.1 DUF1127 domain-containing protein [Undibacter mobilis]